MSRLMHTYPLLVEVCDARDVQGTRLWKLEAGLREKLIIAAVKADLVPGKAGTIEITPKGFKVVYCSSKTRKGVDLLLKTLYQMAAEKRARWRTKAPASTKAMQDLGVAVFGLPNIGKSSLINAITGRRAAPTGFKAGITRGSQWISLGNGLRLLDTPGIVDFKMTNEDLAMRGAFDAEKLRDPQSTAARIIEKFLLNDDNGLFEHYGIAPQKDAQDTLDAIAKKRGRLGPGGEPITAEAAVIVIREWQKGKFGIGQAGAGEKE